MKDLGETGPGLIFGAHLANWELLIWAIGAHPEETAVVYRPSNIAAIDRELRGIRARSKAGLIPAGAMAPFAVMDVLERHGGVGMVVDEYFPRGVDVVFFGRRCKVTPIFARFARRLDCRVLGGRVVRLPGGRFRVALTEPLPLPRDADGKIDVEDDNRCHRGLGAGTSRAMAVDPTAVAVTIDPSGRPWVALSIRGRRFEAGNFPDAALGRAPVSGGRSKKQESPNPGEVWGWGPC
jgi:hypothetical protein